MSLDEKKQLIIDFQKTLRDFFVLGFETEALINNDIQSGALFTAQRRADKLNDIKAAAQTTLDVIGAESVGLKNLEDMDEVFNRFQKVCEAAKKAKEADEALPSSSRNNQ